MFARVPDGPLIEHIRQVSTGQIGEEPVVHIKGAKVVCANYRAIVQDFPQFFGPEASKTHRVTGCDVCEAANCPCPIAINDWLIRNAAFVSAQQSHANGVNSPIALDGIVRTGFRPPDYGRAVVVPVDETLDSGGARFLDLKGAGLGPGRIPSHGPYQDGLEYLGFAIADFLYGWLIDTIFARTYPGYHIVPVYAVLDLGFDIVGGWHGTGPAGMHVRRAHARPIPSESLPLAGSEREKLDLHIEFLLRSFGLSTTGAGTSFRLAHPESQDNDALRYKSTPVVPAIDPEIAMAAQIARTIRSSGADCLEVTNVQMTDGGSWADKTAQIYDFGQVRAERHFPNPVANGIRNAPLNVGRILSPGDASFVQPHPAFALEPDLGNRRSVNALGFQAAENFRREASFGQIHVETMLRIGRLKIMRRDFEWAVRRVARRTGRIGPTASPDKITAQRLTSV